MKSSFLLTIILIFTFQSSFCQVIEDQNKNESAQELFDLYTYKQKQNRNAGWIFLGVGAVMITGGYLTSEKGSDSIGEAVGNDVSGGILAIAGGASVVASVPFFIIASKHKERAQLALKGETISLHNVPMTKSNYVLLSVSISLDN